MAYLIKQDKKTESIVCMEYDYKGYLIKPKNNKSTSLEIKNVTIINPCLIDSILTIKFNEKFKRIAKLILEIANDEDTSSSDVIMVLDEIAKLKGIILIKYRNFLSEEKRKMFLKKVAFLENEIKIKMISIARKEIAEQSNRHSK